MEGFPEINQLIIELCQKSTELVFYHYFGIYFTPRTINTP